MGCASAFWGDTRPQVTWLQSAPAPTPRSPFLPASPEGKVGRVARGVSCSAAGTPHVRTSSRSQSTGNSGKFGLFCALCPSLGATFPLFGSRVSQVPALAQSPPGKVPAFLALGLSAPLPPPALQLHPEEQVSSEPNPLFLHLAPHLPFGTLHFPSLQNPSADCGSRVTPWLLVVVISGEQLGLLKWALYLNGLGLSCAFGPLEMC